MLVSVRDNDVDGSGEKPPLEGTDVTAHGSKGLMVGRARTDGTGMVAFDIPDEATSTEVVLSVRHADFSPRHMRLDGTSLVVDLRRALYGDLLARS